MEANRELKNEAEMQHYDVLSRALEIYIERSEVRGESWADDCDTGDMIAHAMGKVKRLEAGLSLLQDADSGSEAIKIKDAMSDDAVDLINYAAFVVRHLEGLLP